MFYFYTHLNFEADTSPATTTTPPQLFNNSEHPEFGTLRVLTINNDPWFVGKDVAEALGYKLARKAITDHADEKDVLKWNILTNGGKQQMTIINESGLYSLIVGKDVAAALGYAEAFGALKKHVNKEDMQNCQNDRKRNPIPFWY